MLSHITSGERLTKPFNAQLTSDLTRWCAWKVLCMLKTPSAFICDQQRLRWSSDDQRLQAFDQFVYASGMR